MAMNVIACEPITWRYSKFNGAEIPKNFEVFLTLRSCKLNFDNPNDRLILPSSVITTHGLLSGDSVEVDCSQSPLVVFG
jgi:hypothetical protein